MIRLLRTIAEFVTMTALCALAVAWVPIAASLLFASSLTGRTIWFVMGMAMLLLVIPVVIFTIRAVRRLDDSTTPYQPKH